MSKIKFYLTFAVLTVFINSFSNNETRIYKTVNDSIDLKLKIIQPTKIVSGKIPCAIFLSGGGWQDFTWNQLETLAYALADRGILSVTIEYRTSREHQATPYDALEDFKDAIKYLHDNTQELNIDKEKIIAIGVSAGSHLSFSSIFVNTINSKTYSKEIKPNYIIGFSPVIRNDSLGYANDRIGDNYKWFSPYYNYFNTDLHLPPSLIISGIEDPFIKIEYLEEFYKKAIEKDDDVSLYVVENVGHSMRNTYESIYMQSFPIIISFLEDNEIIINSEIIKPFKLKSNLSRNIILTLLVFLIIFLMGYYIKKSQKKG